MSTSSPATKNRAPIADAEEASGLCDVIESAMDNLIATIEEESRLVRNGKVFEASQLQPKKAGLSDVYVKAMLYAREQSGALKSLAPEAISRLQQRHREFRALLRINMAVLSTARDVSEDIVRTVSKKVGKGTKPSTYGNTGANAPGHGSPAPGIAYDRTG